MLKLFCIICLIISCESARILAVFPVPSISHQVVFRPLMQELAKRGHEVVVITADPAFSEGQAPQNLTEIDVHNLSYKIWNRYLATGKLQKRFESEQVRISLEIFTKVFEGQIKSKGVQNLINKKEKFDLLFVEACIRAALSFSHIYNVPVIEFSSLGGIFGTFEGTGASTNSLVYPLPMHQRIYNLTLWEKITELYNHYVVSDLFEKYEEKENEMMRKIFGSSMPKLSDLKKNVQMTFLNVNPIWDFNRPVPPNIIYLGGIHQKPTKELPKDLKSFLDTSKQGVIYMSFGTNARPSLLPSERLKIFTRVFSQLPYDVLWKWEGNEIKGLSKNVKISNWFPQSDLLKHPKIKLFITQGGLQSTDEALTAGVPLIALPFLGDQWFNAEQYVKLNIGIHLNIETVTENELQSAIETVINDSTFKKNIVKLNNLIRDQPQSPLERAVWWTEYVLRHGGAVHLRSAGAHMHWTEYYALDIILLVLSVFIIVFVGCVYITYLLIAKLNYKNPKKLKKKSN